MKTESPLAHSLIYYVIALASPMRGPGSTLTSASLQVNLPGGPAGRSFSTAPAFGNVGNYGRASGPPSTAASLRLTSAAAHSVKGNGPYSLSASARRTAHATCGQTSRHSSRTLRATPTPCAPPVPATHSRHPSAEPTAPGTLP